jgi:16S rRNA processing protein RimM
MINEEDLYKIGKLAKPHGVKGEIVLVTDDDIEESCGNEGNLNDLCIVCDINGIWTPFFIVSYRQKNASTKFVTFDRLDTTEKVKFLTGKTAHISIKQTSPFEQKKANVEMSPPSPPSPDLKDNKPHLSGYTIVDPQHGTLGQVKIMDCRTMNILLTVDYKGNELLIPLGLASSIQHDQKTINLSLPDGYLEIVLNNETEK